MAATIAQALSQYTQDQLWERYQLIKTRSATDRDPTKPDLNEIGFADRPRFDQFLASATTPQGKRNDGLGGYTIQAILLTGTYEDLKKAMETDRKAYQHIQQRLG